MSAENFKERVMVKQPLSIIKIYFQLSLYLLDYKYDF